MRTFNYQVKKMIVVLRHFQLMLTPLAQLQQYKDIEQKLRRLQTPLKERSFVSSSQPCSKEELQNFELQFYSLNRDLAGLANEMACTLFSYYYLATLSTVKGESAESHQ